MGEEKRHQMMQNLFGDQSEEDDEEEDLDSEHESNPHPNFPSDEGEGGEGQGEVEGDMRDVEPDPGESDQSSQEVEAGVQREGRYTDDTDDEKEELTSRRRNAVESGSEENPYAANELHQTPTPPGSPDEEKDQTHGVSTAAVRNVFGDSDDEEAEEYGIPNDLAHDSSRLPAEEEEEEEVSFERSPIQDDIVPDVDGRYESEEEIVEAKIKEKPLGPPMELEIPMRPPPARPDKMNMIKVSNIMGIDSKPFEPKTYVEEDTFVTDESGTKKRIRLENNIVRWRTVRNPDGSISRESNARFVRWSDGSLQLLIGNEVLDITEQDAQHDQAHLFLRHQKGILQSQGRILKKMRFIPSSLTSNSHRLLTALVDSRNKKAFKVKNCVTEFDPEREKEEKEKAESQSIRASLLLSRKREKVSRKYTPNVDRRRQLSPGFLEDALDEEDETDYYDSRRSRNRFEEDLEEEARAERRILNAKKSQGSRDAPRKSSMSASKSSRRPVDFSDSDRGESEYESEAEEDERPPPRRRDEEEEPEFEEEEEDDGEDIEEADRNNASEDEAEEPRQRGKESGHSLKRKGFDSDEESPPRKAASHRRMAVVFDSDED